MKREKKINEEKEVKDQRLNEYLIKTSLLSDACKVANENDDLIFK